MWVYNVRTLHWPRMSDAFLADTFDTIWLLYNICDSAVFCASSSSSFIGSLHDQLANPDRHAQLTRCFSAVAELLVLNAGAIHQPFGAVCSGEVFSSSDVYYVSDARTKASGRGGQREQDCRTDITQRSHRQRDRAQVTTSAYQRLGRPVGSMTVNQLTQWSRTSCSEMQVARWCHVDSKSSWTFVSWTVVDTLSGFLRSLKLVILAYCWGHQLTA